MNLRLLAYGVLGVVILFALWKGVTAIYDAGWNGHAAEVARLNQEKEKKREVLQARQDDKDSKTLQAGEVSQSQANDRTHEVREVTANVDLSPDVPSTDDLASRNVVGAICPDPFTDALRMRINAGLRNGLPHDATRSDQEATQADAHPRTD